MSVVDLDHSELLHKLVIDLQLVLFEGWDDLLAEVDSNDRDKSLQVVHLLSCNFNCSLQFALIFLVLEDSSDSLFASIDVI